MRLHRKTEHRADIFELHANVVGHERVHQRVGAKRIRYALQHQYLPLRRKPPNAGDEPPLFAVGSIVWLAECRFQASNRDHPANLY